jgi:hypothetical protein
MMTDRVRPEVDFWKSANELMKQILPKNFEEEIGFFFKKNLYNRNEMQWFKLCCIQSFIERSQEITGKKERTKYEKDAAIFVKTMFPGQLFYAIDRTAEEGGYNVHETLFFRRLMADVFVMHITMVIIKSQE